MPKFKLIYFVLLLVALSSCVSQDNNDCTSTRMTFSYSIDGHNNALDKHIDHATLYIYNESDGSLIKTINVNKSEIRSLDGVDLKLDAGSYTTICWANMSDNTRVTSEKYLKDARIMNIGLASNKEGNTCDPLYWGKRTFQVQKDRRVLVDMSLKSAYINLEVNLIGFNKTLPSMTTTNVASEYNFNRELIPSRQANYKTNFSYNANNNGQQASLRVFRIQRNNPIHINIQPSTNHKIDLELGSIISSKYPNLNFDQEEITLAINIEFNGIDVTVTIPDWEHKDTEAGII